jgi:hypothetical protein
MKKVRKDLTRLLTESVYAIGADPPPEGEVSWGARMCEIGQRRAAGEGDDMKRSIQRV